MARLPPDHPDFDAEDLPHWWQRLFAEGVGAIVLIVCVVAAIALGLWLNALLF